MSLTASVAILFVLLLRLLLKRAPKVISYALWGVVLFRLLCPVSIKSGLSLFGLLNTPSVGTSERTSAVEYIPSNIVHTEFPEVVLPVPGIGEAVTETLPQGEEQLVADPLEAPMAIATYVWVGGILVMAIYGSMTYVRLRRALVTASPLRSNIYLADGISSPFVMGLFRPKIYLPSEMEEREQTYIILHEQHHIRRLDHIAKALAFVALCVHWFNPLVWVAFILSGMDMEMSCDEAVVQKLGTEIRADYTASLLSLATGRRVIAGMPLAFGEGSTKRRIKNLAHWKKPAFWVVFVAVFVCIALAVCLLTNPKAYPEESQANDPLDLRQEPSAQTLPEDSYEGFWDRILHRAEGIVALSDSAAMVSWSDLDHNHTNELIFVQEQDQLHKLVVWENGEAIWTMEAGLPHTGWNTILLYNEDGQDYLVRYDPVMYQGMGNYTCTVFSLEGGRQTVKEELSVDFEVQPGDPVTVKETPEMKLFAQKVNLLLQNGTVLLSTEQGILVDRPVSATTLPQLYPVRFDPYEVQAAPVT